MTLATFKEFHDKFSKDADEIMFAKSAQYASDFDMLSNLRTQSTVCLTPINVCIGVLVMKHLIALVNKANLTPADIERCQDIRNYMSLLAAHIHERNTTL